MIDIDKIFPFGDISSRLTLVDQLNHLTLDPHPTYRTRVNNYYADMISFDIETSRIPDTETSIMYIWQLAINDICYTGRTWEEFVDFIEMLLPHTQATFVCYVHNLQYEFEWLQYLIPFDERSIVATDNRKVIRCRFRNIEFRDSYALTRKSLRKFLRDMGVKTQKTELDYNVFRDSETLLTYKELEYCVSDVLGLNEALRKYIYDVLHKDHWTIPLTSTGLVREDMRNALKNAGYYQKYHKAKGQEYGGLYPIWREDERTMQLLISSFRGGNTHGNRFFCGAILENVNSADRSSSYPDVMVNRKFPMGQWHYEAGRYTPDVIPSDKPSVFKVIFENIRLRKWEWPVPYLSLSKCDIHQGLELDNGRILSADVIRTCMNDVDWKIVQQEYVWDRAIITEISVNDRYDFLPDCVRDVVNTYYRHKTEWKNVAGREDDYALSKELLNACYGMTAQNRLKPKPRYHKGRWLDSDELETPDISEYYKDAFLPYCVGCWVTAWARDALEAGLRLAGSRFVYADTDSVKYIGDISFDGFNAKCVRDSRANGSTAVDSHGVMHYTGVFEQEESYERFTQLGAKKYAYDQNGALHITIAGVSKDGCKELGRLENFRDGFVFTMSAGTRPVFNDEFQRVTYNGKSYDAIPNICLIPVDYTISISDGLGDYYLQNIYGNASGNEIF